MKKMLFLIFILLLSCTSVDSNTEYVEDEDWIYWKSEIRNNTIYLIPSIHVGKKGEIYYLNENIEKAYDESDVIIFELENLDDDETLGETLLGLLNYASYTDGETLQTNISEELYNDAKKLLKDRYNSSIEMFSTLKPLFLGINISLLENENLGYTKDFGLDNYYFLKAKQDNKKILGLETITMQIKSLAELDRKMGEEFLKDTVNNISNTEEELKMLNIFFKEKNTAEIEKYIKKTYETELGKEYNNILLEKRNKNMIMKLENYINSEGKTYFVVVGGLHYFGKNNIRNLLEEKGYTIMEK